jgi:hypothetical protein
VRNTRRLCHHLKKRAKNRSETRQFILGGFALKARSRFGLAFFRRVRRAHNTGNLSLSLQLETEGRLSWRRDAPYRVLNSLSRGELTHSQSVARLVGASVYCSRGHDFRALLRNRPALVDAPIHRLDSDDRRQCKTCVAVSRDCQNVRRRAPMLALPRSERR